MHLEISSKQACYFYCGQNQTEWIFAFLQLSYSDKAFVYLISTNRDIIVDSKKKKIKFNSMQEVHAHTYETQPYHKLARVQKVFC